MSGYKYNDDIATELRKTINDWYRDNPDHSGDQMLTPIDIMWATLNHRFDLQDDVDRGLFIANILTDFANGCDIDFAELFNRASKIQPDSNEDKIKKLKNQLAELEDELREG